LAMVQEADAQAEYFGLEAVHQRPDGLRLSPQAATHQSRFFGCHVA